MTNKNLNLIDSTRATPEIIERISYDDVFNDFISVITNGIEDFASENDLEVVYEFYFREDWEIEDQRNLILSVLIKNIDDFKERLLIGNEISFYLRDRTENLINQESTTKKNEFLKLDSQFFVFIE